MAGISSRTRSKNVPLFGSISLERSTGRKSDLGSVFGCKRRVKEEPFVLPKDANVINIDDDDDDDNEDDNDGGVEIFEGSVDVKKEVKSEESSGSDEIGGKDESFGGENWGWVYDNPIIVDEFGNIYDDDVGNGGVKGYEGGVDVKKEEKSEESEGSDDEIGDKDENYGWVSDNPITVDESGESDEEIEDSDSDSDDDDETSDEDYRGDEVNEVSDSDEDSSCSSSYVDDNAEEEEGREEKKMKVEKGGICKRKFEEARIEKQESSKVEVKSANVSDDDDDVDDEEREKKKVQVKKGEVCKRKFEEVKIEKQQESSRVEVKSENVSDGDNEEGKQQYRRGLSVGTVEKMMDSSKKTMMENKRRDHKGEINFSNCEKMVDSSKKKMVVNKRKDHKGEINISNGENRMNSSKQKKMESNIKDHKGGVNFRNSEKKESTESKSIYQTPQSSLYTRKELQLVEMLAECYWGNKNTNDRDSMVLERKDDNVNRRDTKPLASKETRPLIWSLNKVEKVPKTKEEEEEEELWNEMSMLLREEEAKSMIGNIGTNEAIEKMDSQYSSCKHDIRVEDDIGEYCKLCGWVVTEMKYISPPVIDRYPNEGYEKRASYGGENVPVFDGSQFNVYGDDSNTHFSLNEGTVWDLIPEEKQSLYPHQQEGFEFIWKNLAGSIDLRKLMNAGPRSEGGCIISHAPGTGKTRLTIVFLMAYLQVFPKCRPVIVAPASLLLTWEDEFKKWGKGITFHNLNNPELSGKEHDDAVDLYNPGNTVDVIRMVKMISWFKEKSIIGISYNLYEILAGGGETKDRRKRKREHDDMKKYLVEVPGLLVLDEGHTPRNQRSGIWKVFSEMQTPKRIILSGTPFQNNLTELYNTLSLAKPSFPNMLSPQLKKFCLKQEHKAASKELSWEPVYSKTTGSPSDDKLKQLKLITDSFVHVHKGSILQKKLPGLRDCVQFLKPDSFQKQIIDNICIPQNPFKFERKMALASIHPSLFLECSHILESKESFIDKERLKNLRLNPYGGVKTRFLVEFVRLCDAVNEKVLVFSQYLDTLNLIIDQLNSVFNWSLGKEVLFMSGKDDKKDKQYLIHSFNDPSCQAKILLASTKACSEGISLVGASRVVLLDVVWNPSVERQAISRAYRLGQKRVVYTYHLITEGTSEWDKYCKQAKKDRLSEQVFAARNADNDKSKSSAADFEDKVLDQMTRHEKLKDMFGECVLQPKERDMVESFGLSL